nr:universal stress protein [Thiocapsa imhoffii]
MRQCPCPVWLTKCHAGRSFRRILAAIDVTAADGGEDETRRELNRRILELAASLAFSESAELHVAYVWEALGEELMRGTMLSIPEEQITAYVSSVHARCAHALEALVTEVLGGLGAPPPAERKPKLHLPRGAARKKIPALAERLGADLIVMGTLARCGIPGLIMGNTAETILRQVDCSVLAIKPVGFTSSIQASA